MRRTVTEKSLRIFTVGHSTRTIESFVELLHAHAVTRLADVRTIPRSRHNPQFNRDSLSEALAAATIAYTHMASLGGLRRARRDSPNTGWRNLSFRGFADYMQTAEFAASLEELIGLAKREQIVIMCAEAVPWRCHRSLIADALLTRGILVEHIINSARRQPHSLTPWARLDQSGLTYPAEISQTVGQDLAKRG